MRQERKYWYIRDDRLNELSSFEMTFSVYQKRRPQISEDDVALLYSNGYFKRYGFILGTPERNQEKTGENFEEESEFKYIIGDFQLVEEPNDLDGFAYSLEKIYKYFNEPAKHFKRDFGSISEHDFQTIINHKYFFSRTAFGRIINSLHPDHKRSFIKYLTQEYPEALISNYKDYNLLFEILKEYVDYNIIAQVEMLKEINLILTDALNIEQQVGFMDPTGDSNKIFVIHKQVERIQNASENIEEGTNLETIVKEINNINWEEKYKHRKLFNERNLPIIL